MPCNRSSSVLRAIGFTKARLTYLILLKLIPLSVTSGLIGYTLGYSIIYILSEYEFLRILLHTVLVTHNLNVLVASLVIPSVVTTASLLIKSGTLLNIDSLH